jgi:hypothetical protein
MTTKLKHKWNPGNPGSLRWSGEYSDYIERPPQPKRGPNFRKPKRKK